jgi:arylsulfatase A-like enzyme
MNRVTALLASVVFAFASFAQPQGRPPNVVFILADDLGYGDLGCYGQKQLRTPNIDRLAGEGMRFTQAYAGATVCAPSRCALMTGLHGGHMRIRGNKKVPLRAEDFTAAELFKQTGYATALCGKWGLGQHDDEGAPNKHGFDFFFGYADQTHAHNYYSEYLWKNDQKVALPNVVPAAPNWKVGQGVASERKVWSHDLIEAEALKWIRANHQKPFFLYLAITLPHANNEGKQAGMEVPSTAAFAEKDWPAPEKGKAEMIRRMDEGVGAVMGLLKELNVDNNTLVIFASDNGPHNEGGVKSTFFQSSGPLRGTKRDLYEGGIRVPFIARWPGKVPAGVTSDVVTAFWDFLPTAADIAGATDRLPKDLDGRSILPTLLGKEQKPPAYLYFEFHERGFDQAVRFGDWKAVRLGFGQPIELYDLKSDLGETKNVAAARPDVVKQAEALMASARSDSADFPVDKRVRPQGRREAEESARD